MNVSLGFEGTPTEMIDLMPDRLNGSERIEVRVSVAGKEVFVGALDTVARWARNHDRWSISFDAQGSAPG